MQVIIVENYRKNKIIKEQCKENKEYSFIDVNKADVKDTIANVVAKINMARNIGCERVYLINPSRLRVGKVTKQGYVIEVDEIIK